MHPFVRLIGAVLMGLIVAFAVSFGIEFLNNLIYPFPPGTDYSTAEAKRAALAALPQPALIGKLVGWFLASVAAAWVAVRIGRGDRRPAWVLGLLLLVSAIANMRLFPHPIWFWVIGVALYPVAIMLGIRLGAGPEIASGVSGPRNFSA